MLLIVILFLYDLYNPIAGKKDAARRGGARRSARASSAAGFTHQNYSVADSVGERPLRRAKRLTSNV